MEAGCQLVDVAADARQLGHRAGIERLALLDGDAAIADQLAQVAARSEVRRRRALLDKRPLARGQSHGQRRRPSLLGAWCSSCQSFASLMRVGCDRA